MSKPTRGARPLVPARGGARFSAHYYYNTNLCRSAWVCPLGVMHIFDVAQRYFEWLKYGRKKPVTLQTSETVKKVFRVIISEFKNCDVSEINEALVMDLRKNMINRGNSLAYIEKVLIYLRSFLRYCKKVEKLSVMESFDIELPPRENKNPDYYTEEELSTIFSAIDQTSFDGMRTFALIITILSTGMRITETCSLKRNIDRNRGLAEVIGKGNKEGYVFFHDWCFRVLDKYLKMREDSEPWMFVSNYYRNKYTKLTPDCARNYLQGVAKRVGFQVCPHKLRRTAATTFHYNGGDIFDIQQFLRHSRITTTQLYVGVNYRKIQLAHDKYIQYKSLEQYLNRP